jgi:hypothetical protein
MESALNILHKPIMKGRINSFRDVFILVFWFLCIYYFWVQANFFDLAGNYIGGDMVTKFVKRFPTGATNTYYKNDQQTVRHEKFYSAMADKGFFQIGHLAGGFAWWGSMFVQLTGVLRKYSPKLHIWTGFFSFMASQAVAFSGFYGLMNNRHDLSYAAYSDEVKQFTGVTYFLLNIWKDVYIYVFWIHGAYMSFTAFMYLYYIILGDKQRHGEWILRHCMVGLATIMKRISFGMWPLVLTYSPINLHGLPSSIVKVTIANVWIFLAHPFGEYLINLHRKKLGLDNKKTA